MDPMELRRKNWIKHEEFPFTTVAGLDYDSGNYEAATDKAMQLFGYDELRAEQAAAASRTTRSSSASASPPSPRCAAWRRRACSARCATAPAAGSTPRSGCCPPARSRSSPAPPRTARATRRRGARSSPTSSACRSRTSRCCTATPRSRPRAWTPTARGRWPSAASRWSRPAQKVRRQGPDGRRAPAGGQRGRPRVRPAGRSGCGARRAAATTIQEIALAAFAAHNLPDGVEPTLDADATFDPDNFSFPHGTHLCAVEVDTETGVVTIRKYVCVDDVGKVVNPLIVEGQVHGGVAQGIAQALFEEAVYDDDGNLITGIVRRLPGAVGAPTCRTSSPTDTRRRRTSNPSGVKGVGEAGTHRLDAGRGQRRRRRAAAPRRDRHPHAAAPPSGCGGRSRGRRRRGPRHRRHQRLRRRADRDHRGVSTPESRLEATDDPRRVRLRPADHRRRGGPGARRRRRGRQGAGRRAEPDAGAAAAAGRAGHGRRPGPGGGAARRPGRRRRAGHRRDDHARRRLRPTR